MRQRNNTQTSKIHILSTLLLMNRSLWNKQSVISLLRQFRPWARNPNFMFPVQLHRHSTIDKLFWRVDEPFKKCITKVARLQC